MDAHRDYPRSVIHGMRARTVGIHVQGDDVAQGQRAARIGDAVAGERRRNGTIRLARGEHAERDDTARCGESNEAWRHALAIGVRRPGGRWAQCQDDSSPALDTPNGPDPLSGARPTPAGTRQNSRCSHSWAVTGGTGRSPATPHRRALPARPQLQVQW